MCTNVLYTVYCDCAVVSMQSTTTYDVLRSCTVFLNVLECSRTFQLEFGYRIKESINERKNFRLVGPGLTT